MKARALFGTRAMQKFAPLRPISLATLSLSMLAMGCLLLESRAESREPNMHCLFWLWTLGSRPSGSGLSTLGSRPSGSGLSTLGSPLRQHFLDRLGAGLGERHRPGADVVVLLVIDAEGLED